MSPWGFDPARIRTPTTLFYGERDELVGPAHARSWAATVRSASVVTVKQAGHLVPLVA